MKELEKSLLINDLFDIYGKLLSKTQQKMINFYYKLDLSLSEIAVQENVSRNAVYDAIKKGGDILISLEDKLHFLLKRNQFVEKLEKNLTENELKKIKKLLEEDE